MLTRQALPARTTSSRLIVVIRGHDAEQYPAVLETLIDAGVQSVELTMTTPRTLDVLPALVARCGGSLDIGVGTVTTPEEIDRAADGGASYLVTPVSGEDLVMTARDRELPIIAGGLTPTELHASWTRGASAVKIFPAGQVGPTYLQDLHGPFPDLAVIPSGGVDLTSAVAWLEAGALAVSVGGPLLGDALRGGRRSDLAPRAREFVTVCGHAGQP